MLVKLLILLVVIYIFIFVGTFYEKMSEGKTFKEVYETRIFLKTGKLFLIFIIATIVYVLVG